MRPLSFMVIAGEASGDLLAAELVTALKSRLATGPVPPKFFGAGGPRVAAAGVELALDLTKNSVIGFWEAVKKYPKFVRIRDDLLRLAIARQPDAVICVDFSGFNSRFAATLRRRVGARRSGLNQWNPRIIQYVSTQVWASRAARAYQMARTFDLLLCTFPFEPAWYAARVPNFRVEFVGNPIVDRYRNVPRRSQVAEPVAGDQSRPLILLLPGSRAGELRHHVPVILDAARRIGAAHPARFRMILPDESMAGSAPVWQKELPGLEVTVGGLAESLAAADLAISKSGTITLESAYFGVPTVVIYKTSWLTFEVARRLVTVKYMSMANLLADEPIFPELLQNDANGANIARIASEFLDDPARRTAIRAKLAEVVKSLGTPGASGHAANAILKILAP